MMINEPILLAYGGLYLLALGLAVWQRKTFPLADTLTVLVIVGFGFTGLVYLIAPASVVPSPLAKVVPTELIFTLAYLVFVAVLLVYVKPVPAAWKDHFLKKSIATLAYKILVFVLVPLLSLRVIWGATWSDLGFSAGNVLSQLRSAVLLILFFGGFNLLAGGGAAPVRAGRFSARQIAIGFGITFLWNVIEVGLVEEFFFRAFVQSRLTAALGSPAAGISAASLLFGLAHAPGIYLRRGDKHGPLGEHPSLLNSILYAILALSPTGWFTGLLFVRAQSLLAPVLVHAGVDTVAHMSEFIEGLGIRK